MILFTLIGVVALGWAVYGITKLVGFIRTRRMTAASGSSAPQDFSRRHVIDPPGDQPAAWQLAVVYGAIGFVIWIVCGGGLSAFAVAFPAFPYKSLVYLSLWCLATLPAIWTNVWLWARSHGKAKPYRVVVTVDEYFNWFAPFYLLVGHKGGLMRVYTPHASGHKVATFWKWAWEKPEYTVDIEGVTRDRELVVRTFDGGEFTVHIVYRETPNSGLILNYIGTDLTTRTKGFDAVIMNPEVRRMQTDGYKKVCTNTEAYAIQMTRRFEKNEAEPEKDILHPIEREYGVHFDNLEIVVTPTERTLALLEERVQTQTFGDNIKYPGQIFTIEAPANIVQAVVEGHKKNPLATAVLAAAASPAIADALKGGKGK